MNFILQHHFSVFNILKDYVGQDVHAQSNDCISFQIVTLADQLIYQSDSDKLMRNFYLLFSSHR